jgi:hypothetical protein
MGSFRNRSVFAVLAMALAVQGCYVAPAYVPATTTRSVPASFDASWGAAQAAAYDEGVRITSEDRQSGTMRGDKGPFNVLISVATQADGSVRVGFSVTGPTAQDPTLQDRLTRAYQRHMGR